MNAAYPTATLSPTPFQSHCCAQPLLPYQLGRQYPPLVSDISSKINLGERNTFCSSSSMQCLELLSRAFMHALSLSSSAPPQYHVSPINGNIVLLLKTDVATSVSAIHLGIDQATVVTLIFNLAATQKFTGLCSILAEMNIRYCIPMC